MATNKSGMIDIDGQKLKSKLEALGMSRRELGLKVQKSPAYWYNFCERNQIDFLALEFLKNTFSITYEDIKPNDKANASAEVKACKLDYDRLADLIRTAVAEGVREAFEKQ